MGADGGSAIRGAARGGGRRARRRRGLADGGQGGRRCRPDVRGGRSGRGRHGGRRERRDGLRGGLLDLGGGDLPRLRGVRPPDRSRPLTSWRRRGRDLPRGLDGVERDELHGEHRRLLGHHAGHPLLTHDETGDQPRVEQAGQADRHRTPPRQLVEHERFPPQARIGTATAGTSRTWPRRMERAGRGRPRRATGSRREGARPWSGLRKRVGMDAGGAASAGPTTGSTMEDSPGSSTCTAARWAEAAATVHASCCCGSKPWCTECSAFSNAKTQRSRASVTATARRGR